MNINKSLLLIKKHYKNNNLHEAKELCLEILNKFPASKVVQKELKKINIKITQVPNLNTSLEQKNNLISLYSQGLFQETINESIRLAEIFPNDEFIYNIMGASLKNIAKDEEAITAYKQAIKIKPDYAEAYNNLGSIYKETQDFKKAHECFIKAISLNPNYTDAYYNFGNMYEETNNFEKAIECFSKAIMLDPIYTSAYNNIGNIYKEKGNLIQALKYYNKVIELTPDNANIYNNLGNIHEKNNNFEKALECYVKVLSLNPNNADAYNNLGGIDIIKNNFKKAQDHYNKAISLDPNHLDAHFNLSLSHLSEKNYPIGFNLYRYRYDKKRKETITPIYDREKLLDINDEISDKTILITKEQGFGDILQFVRFLPFFIEKGAKIIFQVPEALQKILEYNYSNIEFITKDKNIIHDYNFPIMDSPYFLHTDYDSIPYSESYISIKKDDSKAYKEKYSLFNSKRKIGISYKGSKLHTNDENRSINLELFLNYFNNSFNDNIEFYSLQYGATPQENEILKKFNITNLSSKIDNFYDTALFVDNMDLIISVDTSLVHLSGAMGKDTIVLLPFSSDWRWGVDNDSTNWYSHMQIFKQTKYQEWDTVLKSVLKNLAHQ